MKRVILLFVACVAGFLDAGARASPVVENLDEEDVRLWRTARGRILANIDGVRSIEGEYRMSAPMSDVTVRRHYTVEFAIKNGMMLQNSPFDGASYQRVVTTVEGSERTHIFEHATPGGRNGQIRTRWFGRPYLEVGGDHSLSCSLPHTAARYFLLDSLLRSHPGSLQNVEHLNDDAILFRFKGYTGNAEFELECEPDKAFMPRVIRTFSRDEQGVLPDRPTSVVTADYAAFPGPDGSDWYYPVSGRVVSRHAGREIVDTEWQVDAETLKINHNIPDTRFFLVPRPDEGLIEVGTMNVIRPPEQPAPRVTRASAPVSPTPVPTAPPAPANQPVFSTGGVPAWTYAGGLGLVLMAAGLVLYLRQRRA